MLAVSLLSPRRASATDAGIFQYFPIELPHDLRLAALFLRVWSNIPGSFSILNLGFGRLVVEAPQILSMRAGTSFWARACCARAISAGKSNTQTRVIATIVTARPGTRRGALCEVWCSTGARWNKVIMPRFPIAWPTSRTPRRTSSVIIWITRISGFWQRADRTSLIPR
jgi:hypothetical protein